MYPILETQNTVDFLPKRFTQVKRINNNNEVGNFYKDCIRRLRNATHWNYMSLFNFAYKVTIHDSLGLLLHRDLEKGDYLKVTAPLKDANHRDFWFLVEDISAQREPDSSEESMCITLSESENPKLAVAGVLKTTLHNKCELCLRRLINTISMDIKLANQNTIDQSTNFLNYFRWEVFAKNILLQL